MKPAIVLSATDNVATALENLDAGIRLELSGIAVTTREAIASGHKVALRRIAAGEPVVKYGSPIGVATGDIEPGAHVHTHNLASRRGRGDLDGPATPAEPRLAEPDMENAAAGAAGMGVVPLPPRRDGPA